MKPVLQALVVADRIYEDKSGKKIIVGTFNTWAFSRQPPIGQINHSNGTSQRVILGGVQAGSPSAYLSLTDVCDGTKLILRFVNLTKNMVILSSGASVKNTNRLEMVELVFPLPALPIVEAGTYALEVLCEGAILGSWRITGIDLDSQKKKES